PHAEVMIHQVLGGARGPATDIEIRTRHLLRTKKLMNDLLARMTGQPLERIERDTDRDNYMSAQEAKDYGLVDTVLERLPASQLQPRPASPCQGEAGRGCSWLAGRRSSTVSTSP